jgi:hypothetical protein
MFRGIRRSWIDVELDAASDLGMNWCWTIQGPDAREVYGDEDGWTLTVDYDRTVYQIADATDYRAEPFLITRFGVEAASSEIASTFGDVHPACWHGWTEAVVNSALSEWCRLHAGTEIEFFAGEGPPNFGLAAALRTAEAIDAGIEPTYVLAETSDGKQIAVAESVMEFLLQGLLDQDVSDPGPEE